MLLKQETLRGIEDGSITAILYVVDPIEGPFLSNAVSATLGDGAGP